ncbi:hypothetical protein MPSEU_000622200 [Mayamaea pseudoterrestris]|nr:hypothetical protein MPSEU_000622200 [Mayamaea pseudoterrestris]
MSSSSATNSLSAVLSDPLHVSLGLFIGLILYVFYLLLPRGIRKQYFGAYPKRHAWSNRSRSSSGSHLQNVRHGSVASSVHSQHGQAARQRAMMAQQQQGGGGATYANTPYAAAASNRHAPADRNDEHGVHFDNQQQQMHPHQPASNNAMQTPNSMALQQDEIVISAAMQQLRDPGVLIIAHGSRGKPKSVRLLLTESTISWRTENRKTGSNTASIPFKVGKLHQVPLAHIMYVDVGKQTTALRRVENASVPEQLCFSLLTKEGSLDLEANSLRERDALVSCFSLVLDEVHAQNWREIYRGPSSDMPSSFDETDMHK